MPAVIALEQVVVEYGSKRALDKLTLTVEKGELFGFIGPNGAGKSSTIKTILGLLRPAEGRVTLNGQPASDPASRARVGYLPEETRYQGFLTPLETLRFYGRLSGVPKDVIASRSRELLTLVGLWELRDKLISTFSKGMTQKVSLAQSLIHDPDILILDEPNTGLDPVARLDLRALLKDLKARGKTIFFSSHELSEVELISDRVALVHQGRLLKQGTVAEIAGAAGGSLENLFISIVKAGRP